MTRLMTDRDRLYELLECDPNNLPDDDELISAALTHIIAMERQLARLREWTTLMDHVLKTPSIRYKREIEDGDDEDE